MYRGHQQPLCERLSALDTAGENEQWQSGYDNYPQISSASSHALGFFLQIFLKVAEDTGVDKEISRKTILVFFIKKNYQHI